MTLEYVQPGLPGTPVPSRPKETDQYVIDNALDELCDEVIQWLRQHGESNPDRVEVIEDLKKAIDGCFHQSDGYRLAKELEDRCHWDPDRDLVETLDNYDVYLSSWHDKALVSWVKAYDIKPQFAVGDLVTIMARPKGPGLHVPVETPGEIVKIHSETGTYTVYCESLGHIRENKPGEPYQTGTLGLIINYEDAQPRKEPDGQKENDRSSSPESSTVNPEITGQD